MDDEQTFQQAYLTAICWLLADLNQLAEDYVRVLPSIEPDPTIKEQRDARTRFGYLVRHLIPALQFTLRLYAEYMPLDDEVGARRLGDTLRSYLALKVGKGASYHETDDLPF